MSVKYSELKFLASIYKYGEPVPAYHLYKDLRILYSDYFSIINKLLLKNYIEEKDKLLEITPRGVDFLLKEKNSYYYTGLKPWKDTPNKFKIEISLQPNSFYIPSRRKLDNRHFTTK